MHPQFFIPHQLYTAFLNRIFALFISRQRFPRQTLQKRKLPVFTQAAQGISTIFCEAAVICWRCSSVNCLVGIIFTQATGTCAHILPSLFSVMISHFSGRSAANFLILVIYRPCEKETVARSLSFTNSHAEGI